MKAPNALSPKKLIVPAVVALAFFWPSAPRWGWGWGCTPRCETRASRSAAS